MIDMLFGLAMTKSKGSGIGLALGGVLGAFVTWKKRTTH